jgi:hypothetical protein
LFRPSLGVQPHRGNHTATSDGDAQDAFDDDDLHPRDYHQMVAYKIRNLEYKIDKRCTGSNGDKGKEAIMSVMNELSQDILLLIYGKPNKARLTKIADSFLLGNHIGCSGADSVGSRSASSLARSTATITNVRDKVRPLRTSPLNSMMAATCQNQESSHDGTDGRIRLRVFFDSRTETGRRQRPRFDSCADA